MKRSTDWVEIQDFENSRVHAVGRPPKLTSEKIEEMCDYIIHGLSIAKSANFCGVSDSTIYRWLAIGRQPGATGIYKELADRVAQATEFSEAEALQLVRVAAMDKRNWRAAAWILERRFPEKYGRPELPEKSAGGKRSKPSVQKKTKQSVKKPKLKVIK